MSQPTPTPTQQDRLKASLWFTLGKLIDEESARLGVSATPQFIGAMTEMAWVQIENLAADLESFSQHAGRSTVTTDDVLLVARRNEALGGIMREFVEREEEKAMAEKERERGKGKGGRKGRGK